MCSVQLTTDNSDVLGTDDFFAFQDKGCMYRMFHLSQKHRVKQEFYQAILENIQQEHQLDSLDVTERVLKYTLKLENIKWKKGKELNETAFTQIKTAVDKVLHHSGPGVLQLSEDPDDGTNPIASVVDFFVLKRKKLTLGPLLSWKFFKIVCVKNDPVAMQQFRDALQAALDEGFAQFNPATNEEEDVFRIFVFNIVAFLAYSYPGKGDEFKIPVKIGDAWIQVTYAIDKKFALTPSWFSSPIPAFGLMPKEGENVAAPPMISFLGTTFPGGEGFIATVLSDFTPFLSVGHAASLYGKKQLSEWLDEKNSTDVRVAGISLGGSLTLHAARLHASYISEAYAFDPGGNYPWNKYNEEESVGITIAYQWNDLVATMGSFPDQDDVNIYRILSEKKENFLNAHQRVYTGGENVTLIKTTSEFENKRSVRRFLTGAHLLGSPLIFSLVLPMHLAVALIRPVYNLLSLHYIEKKERHWSDIAVILSVIAVGVILIGLGTAALAIPQTLFPSWLTHFVTLIGPKGFIALASSIIALGALLAACGLRGAFRAPLNTAEATFESAV